MILKYLFLCLLVQILFLNRYYPHRILMELERGSFKFLFKSRNLNLELGPFLALELELGTSSFF